MKESKFLKKGQQIEHLLLTDSEADIKSVEYFGIDAIQNVVSHLWVHVALLSVTLSLLRRLDPRGVKRSILILVRGKESYVLKLLHSFGLRQLEQASFFHVLFVAHRQLLQALGFPPFLQEPHSSIKKLTGIVHVTQVGWGQSDVGIELIRELFEVRQRSPDDQTSQRMTDKANSGKARERAVGLDEIFQFSCHSFAHIEKVAFCFLLVSTTA